MKSVYDAAGLYGQMGIDVRYARVGTYLLEIGIY